MSAIFISVSAKPSNTTEPKQLKAGLKVKANLPKNLNDRAQVKSIWAGECDISSATLTMVGAMLADAEQSEWATQTEFQPSLTTASIAIANRVAMTASAPNRENALALMNFASK
jgi:iron(III) transport system substrate-binding protein